MADDKKGPKLGVAFMLVPVIVKHLPGCPHEKTVGSGTGPSKVNSPEYINNYQRIFGGAAKEGIA